MPDPERLTVMEAIKKATAFLKERGVATPRLDAEVLMAWALGATRIELYLRHDQPLSPEEVVASREALRQRIRGAPVAYITGTKEFRGRSFGVGPGVLCPRPETELLVDEALALARRPEAPEALRIADLGTGSGIIAITLALELPAATLIGVDISQPALNRAAQNAELLSSRVELFLGDLFAPLLGADPFDLVVSNPPYLSAAELEAAPPEVQCEPREALVSEPEPWSAAERILRQAPAHLRPGGAVLLEMGAGQATTLRAIANDVGVYTRLRVERDAAGIERVLVAQLEPTA